MQHPALSGVRAAAKDLGLAASTLSRYLKQNPELNRGTAEKPLVIVDEVRGHRSRNVNGLKSGNHAGLTFDQYRPQAEAPVAAAPMPPVSAEPSYADHKSDKEAVLAAEAKLRLAGKLEQTLERRTVEDAAFGAGQAVKMALSKRNRDLAPTLAAMDDAAAIRALLDRDDDALLERIANDFERQIGGGPRGD